MKDAIVCLATFSAKPGCTEKLKSSLSELLVPTRAEEGCLSYELYQEIDDENTFTMIEVFKNQEAFDFHGSQPYLLNFKGIAGQVVSAVTVKRYKRVQEA